MPLGCLPITTSCLLTQYNIQPFCQHPQLVQCASLFSERYSPFPTCHIHKPPQLCLSNHHSTQGSRTAWAVIAALGTALAADVTGNISDIFYLSELIHHSSIIFRFTTSCQDKAKFPFSLRFKWKSLSIFWLASIQVPEDKCYIFDYLIPKFWKMQNKVDLLSHNALLAALRLAAQH